VANLLFFRLYQCANMLHKTGTKAVESEGLTTQRWAVLGALSAGASRTQQMAGPAGFGSPSAGATAGTIEPFP
jgi:hypothetical protein